ncbi:uncharacterized protein [Clytia hemisphaerica]|uniref:LIM zinc-binding domain-containing protein n=1 Tax=Clytia hemisphaerica TaxID=252671 RepID=A0A7M5XJ42_9CNID
MPSVDELAAQAAEQMRLYEDQKETSQRRQEAAKNLQNASLQDKLNARLKKKEEKQKIEQEKSEKYQLQASAGPAKVNPPKGVITFGYFVVKNVAVFWENLDEDNALKVLEEIHELITKELVPNNVYLAKEEIGKCLLAAEKPEQLINMALKIQENFNNHSWSSTLTSIPSCKKLVRPEDTNNADAKPLFNGPRIQMGIHSGDAATIKDNNGNTTYSGINILKVESIGNFAQPGQILVSSMTWSKIDASKLVEHHSTQPGVYKLDGFSGGCKVAELLPISLKDRSKFFGSVCANCNDVIKPNEQFFKALNCIWHINHFRCFQCNTDLGGSYVDVDGSPFCKNCYLLKNAPKCKGCSNPITGAYINAIGAYWHGDCFSCRQCLRKPSPDVQMYEKDGLPYCGECYKQMMN